MSNITPVEALQRESAVFYEQKALLKGDPARAGITIGALLYEALIELAKADADLVAHVEMEPKHAGAEYSEWVIKNLFIRSALKAARTKLYKAFKS